MPNSIPNIINKNVILGGDFNLFFNTSLETQGRNPILKKKSLEKLIEIKETCDVCNIWTIINPKLRRFTFHQNHLSRCIRRRLDYLLIFNFLQESVLRADVLVLFCSENSRITFITAFKSNKKRGKGLWKINKPLLSNAE